MKRLFKSLVGTVLVGLALFTAPADAGREKVAIGQLAPDFTLTLIDGSKVKRDELRGQVVVLNFWATWCVPCRKELPTLDAYFVARKDAGLRVFALTTEDSVPLYQLKKLFAAMHLSPVRAVRGPYSAIGDAVPTNIVIGRDGIVRYAKAGAFDLDSLNTILVPLLREPAPQ
jgi:peroxiredoxin